MYPARMYAPLGGLQDDLLSLIKGSSVGTQLDSLVANIQRQIRQEAGEGAKQAVMPYVIASMAVGGLGALFGIIALVKSK